ncbi:CAZyme family GT90, partial [Penicillium maclennaniae]|uniref:CAZyme family GT90 n=1 Tax=Penicillium maclennaniae TaxID=1343394 RepID=UPI0025405F33
LFVYWRPLSQVRNEGQFSRGKPHGKYQFDGVWNYERDRDNLLLTQGQCDQAFPDLFAEIDRASEARSLNPITIKELDSITPRNGYIRAMIYDQQVKGSIWSREIATLAAINRALVSSPEPLPNIEFAFNTDDRIDEVALWGYARRSEDDLIWLIPDFGYWSWPEIKAGSTKEVLLKVESAEKQDGVDWSSKAKQLLWRGVARMGPEIRDKLLEVTSGKSWANVKELGWGDPASMKNDYKTMPQHCEYQYVAQTEGNTYSGRLKYLQMCRSVVVSHKLNWIQHHYHLMRASGSEQNFVEVERDWSDLEDKMNWLLAHDEDAQRIADNNVKTFRERYLTQSAEVCYWRRLIRQWATVSDFQPEFYKEDENGQKVWRGLSFESFMLMRAMDWQT